MFELNLTNISIAVIVLATLGAALYINGCKAEQEILKNKKFIEFLPALISSLGVFGTFLGITYGLYHFDPKDLNNSIPELLTGLKTAFYTSLVGMGLSYVLTWWVNKLFDNTDSPSNISVAASQICSSVATMSRQNAATIQQLQQVMTQQAQQQSAFYNTVGSSLAMLTHDLNVIGNNLKNEIAKLNVSASSQEASLRSISQGVASTNNTLDNIATKADDSLAEARATGGVLDDIKNSVTAAMNMTNEALKSLDTNMAEVVETTSGTLSVSENMNEEVHKFSEVIRTSMDDTNTLLTKKFDEFSDLLKKSNTESLVKVMEKVTVEFQKQMHELITRLIKQNFDELNQSVQKLNTWQQENKQMISSLTQQYKTMSDNFEKNATSLNAVSQDTKALVSDGGKLKQLITSLNQLLLQDKRFDELTKQLLDSAKLSKDNMTEFEQSTKNLNEWVRKNHSFVDQVQILLKKLEELNNLRDYSQQFWKETKKGMEDGVNIIQKGSSALQTQLTDLDVKFYNRLSVTLSELDRCIQAMINADKKK